MSKRKLPVHDHYIRALMANKETTREFFEANLPKHIKEAMDFSTIEPQRESFIDDKLKLEIADLLYSVKINGKQGYCYLLVEHMSSQSKLLPYRMLRYMIGIMDYHLKKTGDKTLPFIYPIILYSGSKPYKHSMDLFDLFGDNKELVREVLFNPYPLIDLTQSSDEELKKYKYFGLMALLAKHIQDEDILPILKDVLYLLKDLDQRGEVDYIYLTISYIAEAAEVSSKEEFIKTVSQLRSVDEEKLMTIVEQFKPEILKRGIEKGLQQGKVEGKVEAAHEIAFNLLKTDLSEQEISKATNLSIAEIKKLRNKIH